ncbi:MAG: peroxidase family protein, partial [Deltaproteobacteria bacterium]
MKSKSAWLLMAGLRFFANYPLMRQSEVGSCIAYALGGLREIPAKRTARFLGKVQEDTARCRGGSKAVAWRKTPWIDWQKYRMAGGEESRDSGLASWLGPLSPNQRGINGALIDLEYQRLELLKFNLFDNSGTYEQYVRGRDGAAGRTLKTWPQLRLPKNHPAYASVGGDGPQRCAGELIRFRTLTGICNDINNPLMGSTDQPFARNVEFDATYPDLAKNEIAVNRHGARLGLLQPDPQVISRRLFTRIQRLENKCNEGQGLPGYSPEANCDYQKAPHINVLAAFWIQFMTHDWFSHLDEGHNDSELMAMGCNFQQSGQRQTVFSSEGAEQLGCRPDDRIDKSYVAEDSAPKLFTGNGQEYLSRAYRTTLNRVTAWWDASQVYGYSNVSRSRVRRDARDRAQLLLEPDRSWPDEGVGYLPVLRPSDPMNPQWSGQESVAFPDNWNIGLSFFHNVFAREHNVFVKTFRERVKSTPEDDSGLRNPEQPNKRIAYKDITDDELFEIARLVVSAEIAKIHTLEWTTQLLYNEPLFLAMKANWSGLLEKPSLVAAALEQVVAQLERSDKDKQATQWYSVFASGPGIFGLGNKGKDINGGVNHFGSPFNFPEEFVTVYRLHPMVPDLIEFRALHDNPNRVKYKIPVVETLRGKATPAMRQYGLANWALSMGRQRAGRLTLQNHPLFLQNLSMPRLKSATGKIDAVALDIIRDRERGVPRYNEFRRQYGLKQLSSFDDFVDPNLSRDSPARAEQQKLVAILRELYGQHKCDASKMITTSQVNDDGTPINDCLGHPNGTVVDNIEDVDAVVGWLAEFPRPHGFAIAETQLQVFILNASRRLFSDRFLTSSFRPEFYTNLGVQWVNENGPDGKVMEKTKVNGHEMEVSPLKRVLQRTIPELGSELENVVNVFDPWARDRGEYYSLAWKPKKSAESDPAFK